MFTLDNSIKYTLHATSITSWIQQTVSFRLTSQFHSLVLIPARRANPPFPKFPVPLSTSESIFCCSELSGTDPLKSGCHPPRHQCLPVDLLCTFIIFYPHDWWPASPRSDWFWLISIYKPASAGETSRHIHELFLHNVPVPLQTWLSRPRLTLPFLQSIEIALN